MTPSFKCRPPAGSLYRVLTALVLVLAAGAASAGMNPASPGFPQVDLYGRRFDNNSYSSICFKCHERTPGMHLVPIDNTRYGSHFVYGGAALATRNTAWQKTDAWTSGATSRYGRVGDNVTVTGVPGEMICESCHNMMRNTGRGKVVETDNETTDPSPLCEGCHQKTGTGHHLLTGEESAIHSRPLSTSGPSVLYPPVQPATSEVTYPGANAVNCRSCHKVHRGWTVAGARILKRGYAAAPVAGTPVTGAGVTGAERQFEIGAPPSNLPRLVTDFAPLCDACHKANQ